MIKHYFIFLLAGLLFSPLSFAVSASPTDQLRSSIDQILESISDKHVSEHDKKQRITDLIRHRFDFVALARRAMATNWKKSSREQKKRFIRDFSTLVIENYYGNLKAYGGEKISYVGEISKGKKSLVKTKIMTDTSSIPVDYKMHLIKGSWRIYDVRVEGVSLVGNYRSSYRSIVRHDGIDGLLEKMEKKINEIGVSDER